MATTSKTKPSKQQISAAIDTLAEWFPEEATNLKSNHDAIISHVLGDTNPALESSLSRVEKNEVIELAVEIPKLTPCEEACSVVVVDVIFFAFGLVGLHVSNQERLTRAIIQEMGGETLRGLARAIHAFSTADGAVNKAKALFTLAGQIYNAGGFKAAFKVMKSEMDWWDWVKTGVIAVAQIVAWFATDGVAFVAEAALTIMSAEQLIEDAVKAGQACSQ